MERITLPLQPSRYESEIGHWREAQPIELRLKGTNRRYGFGYVDSTGECRRVYQGPILPGPYAFMYGLPIVIAKHQVGPAPLFIDFEIGDEIELFDGTLLKIRKGRNFNESDIVLDVVDKAAEATQEG